MNSKTFGLLAVLFLTSSFQLAKAEQAKIVPRIGYLIVAFPSAASTATEAFRQGLRELG